MSDFENKVEVIADRALAKLRKWDNEQAAKVVMRDYLSEEGYVNKDNSKLEELLEERHKIALVAADPEIRLKAINSSLDMAAGNEKGGNTTNNQFNFGDFLNNVKD